MLEKFNKYFEIVEADTPDLKSEAFKLRHQVFCVERDLIPSLNENIETDTFDDQSVHFLIKHRRTNNFIAGCRVILPYSGLLQIEPAMMANGCISSPIMSDDRTRIAEYSRVAISKEFTQSLVSPEEKEAAQLLFISVMACATKACAVAGITHMCAAVEPSIIRYLLSIGAHVTKLEPSIDFHGQRIPFILDMYQSLIGVKEKNIKHWELLTNNGQYQILPPTNEIQL